MRQAGKLNTITQLVVGVVTFYIWLLIRIVVYLLIIELASKMSVTQKMSVTLKMSITLKM